MRGSLVLVLVGFVFASQEVFQDQNVDNNIVGEVRKGTDKIRAYVAQVERRARKYKDRMQRWIDGAGADQTAFFQNRSVYFEDRVARRLAQAQSELETQNILLEERENVRKAKADIQKGLNRAAYDILNGEQAAVYDLEKGLKAATADMYRSITEANVDLGDGSGVQPARLDIENGLRRATVDIFKGVRKSRYDYRQGLYAARRDLREADELADHDLHVEEEFL